MTDTPTTVHDPLTVDCPDCAVAPGRDCTIRPGAATPWHRSRYDRARHAAAVPGTCLLCGRTLHRLTDPDDAVHIDPTDAAACPPIPNPFVDYDGWATATNLGLAAGHPGIENWSPPTDTDLPAEHFPGCNDLCTPTSHYLIGDPTT